MSELIKFSEEKDKGNIKNLIPVHINKMRCENYFWHWSSNHGDWIRTVKISEKHENGNDANRLLAAAASWWDNLTTFKRELYIGRHYSDDTPTHDKINTLYKMYNDCSSEDLEQVSGCR